MSWAQWDETALRRDAFLGGRVQLWQPCKGYRSGIDPVLLAATVPAQAGQSVLDLGCGAGAAVLCLGARVPGLVLAGLELQPAYAELARRNGAEVGLTVHEGGVEAPPAALRSGRFDHVIANPPYFPSGARTPSPDGARETGLGESAPLSAWLACAAKRVRPGGTVTVIQRADRLGDLLGAVPRSLGSAQIWPVAPRVGREAALVLLRWIGQGRAALRLHAPLILHEGDRHERDGDSYRAVISAVLREAAPLLFPGKRGENGGKFT